MYRSINLRRGAFTSSGWASSLYGAISFSKYYIILGTGGFYGSFTSSLQDISWISLKKINHQSDEAVSMFRVMYIERRSGSMFSDTRNCNEALSSIVQIFWPRSMTRASCLSIPSDRVLQASEPTKAISLPSSHRIILRCDGAKPWALEFRL